MVTKEYWKLDYPQQIILYALLGNKKSEIMYDVIKMIKGVGVLLNKSNYEIKNYSTSNAFMTYI